MIEELKKEIERKLEYTDIGNSPLDCSIYSSDELDEWSIYLGYKVHFVLDKGTETENDLRNAIDDVLEDSRSQTYGKIEDLFEDIGAVVIDGVLYFDVKDFHDAFEEWGIHDMKLTDLSLVFYRSGR